MIRKMILADIDAITQTFISWNKSREQYVKYFEENQLGGRITLVATVDDNVIGYVNLLWESYYEPFQRNDIPEINDLNVIEKQQKQGIGRALIHAAEHFVADAGKSVIGIGVGQTTDYSAAQHLYPVLGYVPDERGICPTEYGDVVYLTKKLSP